MDQLLEKLFESIPKVRILRLFMQNPEHAFTFPELVKRTNLNSRVVKKELQKLVKIALIKTKIAKVKLEEPASGKKKKIQTRKTKAYYVYPRFELLDELHNLITRPSITSRSKLVQGLKKLGRVKLAIIAGVFLNKSDTRADLLLVGDNLRKRGLENFLHQTESELGKHLQYTIMDTKEFKYRLDMYDRFLRDILEYPHEKLINKLNI